MTDDRQLAWSLFDLRGLTRRGAAHPQSDRQPGCSSGQWLASVGLNARARAQVRQLPPVADDRPRRPSVTRPAIRSATEQPRPAARSRDPSCPIPVVLEGAVSSCMVASVARAGTRLTTRQTHAIKSRGRGRLLLRRLEPAAAGASRSRSYLSLVGRPKRQRGPGERPDCWISPTLQKSAPVASLTLRERSS